MSVAVVLNARAGSLLGQAGEDVAESIADRFGAAGVNADIALVAGDGIVAATDKALARGADRLIVGGGDGTIVAVAGRLIGTETALGVLPLGTANLLARDLGIPLTLDDAVDALATAEQRIIDVAEVNGHAFLNNAVLGLFAKLARERERERGHMTLWHWAGLVMRAIRMMVRYPRLRMTMDLGDGPRAIKATTLVVSNNVYDGGFRAPFHRSQLDRGLLGIHIAKHKSVSSLLRFGAEILVGDWVRDRDLESGHIEMLVVDSRHRRLRITIDGELKLMTPPLVFRIRPAALTMLVPRSGAAADHDEPQDLTRPE